MFSQSFTILRGALSNKIIVALSILTLLFTNANRAHAQAVVCPPNIDFSFGSFTNWTCFTGDAIPGTISSILNPSTIIPTAPVIGRHTLTTGTGVDPYGGFPV